MKTFLEQIDELINSCKKMEYEFKANGMETSANCSGAMAHAYQRAKDIYIKEQEHYHEELKKEFKIT